MVGFAAGKIVILAGAPGSITGPACAWAGIFNSSQSVVHRRYGILANICVVQNLAKGCSRVSGALCEYQYRGVGVSAGRPDHVLLLSNFTGQKVLAVVVCLVNEEGAVHIHFRNGFAAQV